MKKEYLRILKLLGIFGALCIIGFFVFIAKPSNFSATKNQPVEPNSTTDADTVEVFQVKRVILAPLQTQQHPQNRSCLIVSFVIEYVVDVGSATLIGNVTSSGSTCDFAIDQKRNMAEKIRKRYTLAVKSAKESMKLFYAEVRLSPSRSNSKLEKIWINKDGNQYILWQEPEYEPEPKEE